MATIEHTLQLLTDLEVIAVDITKAVKNGGGFFAILPVVFELLGSAKDLVTQAPLSLPELKDIDSEEAGMLATATYLLVKAVVAAVQA